MELREAKGSDFEAIVRLVPTQEELFYVYPKGLHPFTVDQLRFGRRIFWVVFFFVSLAFFGYTISDAILSDVEEVLSSNVFVISLLVLMVLILLPQFLANYLYAFRSRHLWASAP